MPPIQVYTKSPINPAKASGVTPQTTHPAANVPADTDTHTPTPPDRPAPSLTPTRTIPDQGPPPPQPGAVARLPEATGTTSLSPSSLPPPLRAGAGPAPPAPTSAPVLAAQIPGLSYPPQMAIPPPQQPAGFHQRSTATASAPSTWSGPVASPWGAGPGGYQQNASAPAAASGYVPPHQGGSQSGYHGGVQEDGEEGLFSTAVKLAKAAGEKLSAAESEVWRRINGEGR